MPTAFCALVNLPSQLLRLSEGGEPALTHGPEPGSADARAFSRLVELGVLERQEDLTAWDPCVGCDCGADERPIRWGGNRPVAICPVDAGQDMVLAAYEIETYRLQPARLAAQICRAAELDRAPDMVVQGFWLIGRVAADRTLVVAMSTSALRHPATLDRLRTIDQPARFTLIARITSTTEIAALAERGIDVVSPDDAFLPSLPQQPVRLDMQRLREAGATAELPLLAVNAMAVTAVYQGRPMAIRRRDFQVLLVLVREARDGAAALREDLYHALEGSTNAENPPSAHEIDKVIDRLRAAFCAAIGAPRSFGREVIRTVRSHGYRLDIPANRIRAD